MAASPLSAAIYQVEPVSGQVGSVNGSLNGWSVADHYGTSNYQGFIGDLGLMFVDDGSLPPIDTQSAGIFTGDSGDTYDGRLGINAFCIDSETGFVGAGSGTVVEYSAHSLGAAEARYLAEGVDGYRAGGLKRAAYLVQNYYEASRASGDLGASALQAAIWEVLTDEVASVATGDGNYYVRDNTSNGTLNSRSTQVVSLTSQWFNEAEIADWGGEDYDPGDDVVFWLDPEGLSENQSVISLNPWGAELSVVPEPALAMLVVFGMAPLVRRRRSA